MHLILTGATGLVGSAVLQHMITQPSITTISVLSRRPVPQAEGHEKVKVIIQTDFTTYPSEILEQLKGAQGCVWAQGISQSQVTKEEYEKIAYDYPIAAAEAFNSLTSPFKFVYVSGEGATTMPGRFTPLFGVVKGRAESQLLALAKSHASFKPYSLRAGAVDSSAHTEIHKFIPQRTSMMKAVERVGLPVMRLYPSIMCPTRDLARVLTDLAMGDGEPLSGKGVVEGSEGRTLNNVGMRRLAGL